MISKTHLGITLMFPAIGLVSEAMAAPYQIEVSPSFLQVDSSFPNGGSVDGDALGLGVIYYLQVVDTTSGPLLERSFLDKSAFVAGTFTQTEIDPNQETDSLGLNVRLVTQDDMIFEIDYTKTEVGVSRDIKTLNLGVGKYLDGNTTAIVYFETEDDGNDVDTFGGQYRRLVENSVTSTFVAYDLGLAYVDTTNDSGFELSLGGTYYPSERLSIGASFEYLDVGNFDETTIAIMGDYFFTDTLFAGLGFRRSSGSSNIDTDVIAVRAGARF